MADSNLGRGMRSRGAVERLMYDSAPQTKRKRPEKPDTKCALRPASSNCRDKLCASVPYGYAAVMHVRRANTALLLCWPAFAIVSLALRWFITNAMLSKR